MFHEAKTVLDKITALDEAVEGDSNDAEIDAAQELKDAALALVRKASERDIALAELLDEFDHQNDKVWEDNLIQFPRLLAEIHALIEPEFVAEIANAMDLEDARVYELFDRATEEFERIKPPAGDF